MTFADLKTKYPDRAAAFPEDQPKPNKKDLNAIIDNYDCTFPPSFIDFQLKQCHLVPMGEFVWEGFGWANEELDANMNLEEVVKDYTDNEFPDYLTPFRQDNGDFWCFDTRTNTDGEFPVVIWDHNSNSVEKDPSYKWKNFISWLDATMEDEE